MTDNEAIKTIQNRIGEMLKSAESWERRRILMIKVEETLKTLIDESGKTNTQIAAELGMSRQSLSQYMTRKPEEIRLNVLQTILDNLGYELTLKKK